MKKHIFVFALVFASITCMSFPAFVSHAEENTSTAEAEESYNRDLITDAWWDGMTANFTCDVSAFSYELKVKYNDNLINTTTISTTTYDLSDIITKPGRYRFLVRAKTYDGWSNYTFSDNLTISQIANGVWVDASGETGKNDWRFQFTDGSYAADSWQQIRGKWYCFNPEGIMRTGWIDNTYFCNTDGSMLTGPTVIDGVPHLFDYSGRLIQ